jgi:transcriptional regulator with XRE-family HTH domain
VPAARKRHQATVAFGERVRSRREELGWSQRVLAENAEMDWSYTAQVERGERNLALLNILRLAEALDLDPGELMKGLRLKPKRGRGRHQFE